MKNHLNKFAVVLLTTLIFSNTLLIASSDIQNISEIIQFKIDIDKSAVGVAVVIIEGDKVSFHNFGLTNKQSKQATTSDSLFEIGSISKTFTSAALASMVKEGKVKLTDPVQMYLPDDVKMPTKNGKEITLGSLANHSSSLPRLPSNMPYADPYDPYADYTIELMYAFLNDYELTRDIGEKFEYSNLAVGLLGHVLGLIDNKPYAQVISERVLKPLKMNNTFVNVPSTYLDKLSDGHDSALKKTKHWQLPTLAGAGAIKSSTHDMALYLAANINGTPLADAIILSRMQSIDFGADGPKIGLAWLQKEYSKGTYYWHNGGTGGFRTFIGFDPKNKKGMVILENSANGMDDIGNAYFFDSLEQLKSETLNVVKIGESKLKLLNGEYELVPGFIITITNEGEQLIIQATGQPKIPFKAKSAIEFINKGVQARITFETDDKGNALSMTLYQGGQVLKGDKQ